MSSERTALVCMERSEIGFVNPRKPIAVSIDSTRTKEKKGVVVVVAIIVLQLNWDRLLWLMADCGGDWCYLVT